MGSDGLVDDDPAGCLFSCVFIGHGPFSHMFDGMFIPHMRPGKKWKVETPDIHTPTCNPH